MRLAVSHVTIKGINENLEGRLKGLEELFLLRGPGLGGHIFSLKAKRSQVSKKAGKDSQLIFFGEYPFIEHQRRVKGSDITVDDSPSHAFVKNVGIPPRKGPRLLQLGNRMALSEILSDKKRIDLGGVSSHNGVLK